MRAALVAGERAVARDHRRLAHARDPGDAEQRADLALVHRAAAAERRVLLVQREHAAGQALVLQRLAQHPGARRPGLPSSVKPSAPSSRSSAISVSSSPRRPARDRGGEADGHARVARGGVAQGAQHGRAVDHRVGVRHRHHGAEAAGGGGAGAGLEVLLVLLAGHAQVDVRVDEGRAAGGGPSPSIDLGALGHVGAAGGRELGDPRRRGRGRRGRRRSPRGGRGRGRRARPGARVRWRARTSVMPAPARARAGPRARAGARSCTS